MKKMMAVFLMMSLLSVSCNKSGGGGIGTDLTTPLTGDSNSGNGNGTTPSPVQPVAHGNVPEEALTFSTNIMLVNFTPEQEAKYNKAIEIVKLVVATEDFKNQVLNYTYNGQNTYADNRGMTNAQIYQSILDAAETLQPAKNNTMDLEVELYYENSTVVGYTNGGTKRIWVNTKFFNVYSANSVAGNLFHEWLHKLGYTHDFAATAARPHSVPYAVGYIMGNIGKKFL